MTLTYMILYKNSETIHKENICHEPIHIELNPGESECIV